MSRRSSGPSSPRRSAELGLLALATVVLALPSSLAVSASADASSQEESAREEVARLDFASIYRDQVESGIAFQIFKLESEIHRLLVREAEELADAKLLAREAERRGVDVDTLLAEEADAAPVSDAEVEAYLLEHPPEHATPSEARIRVRAFLGERRRIESKLQLIERLRRESGFEVTLAPPVPPRTKIAVGDSPVRGPQTAAVTIVAFLDVRDARSVDIARVIDRLVAEGEVRHIHRFYFRMFDEVALHAAELGLDAQRQGRFWPLYDRLLETSGELDGPALDSLAEELQLERPKDREASLGSVRRGLEEARRLGVTHAPVLFVNGRYWSGTFPAGQLDALVQEEKKAALERMKNQNGDAKAEPSQ